MADGNITVEVSTRAAQAELERLRAENAALKRDLQYARDGLTKGRSRMREDNERLRAALAAIDAALKEQAEPVAWVDEQAIKWLCARACKPGASIVTRLSATKSLECTVQLYTAPPQRKPLSDADIEELLSTFDVDVEAWKPLARAVERAHGIGGDE